MSVEDLATLSRTPGAGLGSSRHRPADEEIAQVVQSLAELGVQWVTMIGGNDSAETLHRLNVAADVSHISLGTVGIPKTIDNDLPAMDHCPGYGSAARYMALSVREAGLDTAAMRRTDPVKIVEVMGRYAGWLAASAVLGRERPGDAPQLVFLPERPRSLTQMLHEVQEVVRARGWAVVVLCENQMDEDAQPLAGTEPVYVDPHGHPYFESPGVFLARQVQSELGLRARYERPGSLQRTAQWALSETDLMEAEMAGAEAVRVAVAGGCDVMVAIQRTGDAPYAVTYETVPLESVAQQYRAMPDELIADSGTDVTEAFVQYARPLIGEPLPKVLAFV